MLHTIYSNSYEILRESLLECAHADWLANKDQLLFQVPIVFYESWTQKDITQEWAKRYGICSQIKTLYPESAFGVVSGHIRESLLWPIWSKCQDESWVERARMLKRIPTLRVALRTNDALTLYYFARNVAKIFHNYIVHRFDWVCAWIRGEDPAEPNLLDEFSHREWTALLSHPDYVWQKALWVALYQRDTHPTQNNGIKPQYQFFRIMHALEHQSRAQIRASRLGADTTPLHVFMPKTIPPQLLDRLVSLGQVRDVTLYIQNPSQEFWIDYEKTADLTHSEKQYTGSYALSYLQKYARPTQQTIRRLHAIGEEGLMDPSLLAASQRVGQKKDYSPLLDSTKTLTERFSYYLRPTNDTLLGCLQSTILHLDTLRLPTKPIANDHSIQLVRCVTPMQRVKTVIDIVRELISPDPRHAKGKKPIKPSDILIALPDFSTYAPLLEGVFRAENGRTPIPYQIVSRNSVEVYPELRTLLHVISMLFTHTDLTSFEELVRDPVMQARFGWTDDDARLVVAWLDAAGFRSHIVAAQANGNATRMDASLEKALDRLILGYATPANRLMVLSRTYAVQEGNAWQQEIRDHHRLFYQMVALCQALIETKARLLKSRFETMSRTQFMDLVRRFVEKILGWYVGSQAMMLLEESFVAWEDAFGGLRISVSLPIRLLRETYEDTLQHTKLYARAKDAVQIADIRSLRNIPFHTVIVLGMHDGIKFPGREEILPFDLTKLHDQTGPLRRYADENFRRWNRQAFFDVLMSAKERFIMLANLGLPQKPQHETNLLWKELESFMVKNIDPRLCDPRSFVRAYSVQMPITMDAKRQFRITESSQRDWKSHNETIAQAITKKAQANDATGIPPFVESIHWEPPETMTLRDWFAEIYAPQKAIFKRMGIALNIPEKADHHEIARADHTVLTKGIYGMRRMREFLRDPDAAWHDVWQYDPSFVDISLRRLQAHKDEQQYRALYQAYQDATRGAQPIDQHISITLSLEQYGRTFTLKDRFTLWVDPKTQTKKRIVWFRFSKEKMRENLRQWIAATQGISYEIVFLEICPKAENKFSRLISQMPAYDARQADGRLLELFVSYWMESYFHPTHFAVYEGSSYSQSAIWPEGEHRIYRGQVNRAPFFDALADAIASVMEPQWDKKSQCVKIGARALVKELETLYQAYQANQQRRTK